MDRREFVQKGLLAGLGLASLKTLGCSFGSGPEPQPYRPSTSEPAAPSAENSPEDLPSMVIVKGEDPLAMLQAGLAGLGGITRFVRQDHLVVIKPNFSVPRTPDSGCITNPELVAELVRSCRQAGAREVRVIDFPFTNVSMCLSRSGIKPAVEAAGGTVYTLDEKNERNFYLVSMTGPVLSDVYYSRDVLDADVFVNFPILKHHGSTEVTLGLKNLMGLIWDRGHLHATDLEMGIAELGQFKKPHLTVMDAFRGIIDNGPSGPGTIREYKQLVLGLDPVAVDAYSADLYGIGADGVGYIRNAANLGVGSPDWQAQKPLEIVA